ncbi:hypothetical protein CDAR_530701 [Caerostris darwini]|uniref:Uncharacterized protein n=1 Tax=Caerostris darwini TaxID=1538125 RepID=A0AAV4VLS9_9ARAC|nr:hypothetical protein CDAR_530701 [Caerostris darwini]
MDKLTENLTNEQQEEIREDHEVRQSANSHKETAEETRLQNELREVRRRRSKDYSLADEALYYDPTKGYNKQKHVVIGKMNEISQFCGAKKFERRPEYAVGVEKYD